MRDILFSPGPVLKILMEKSCVRTKVIKRLFPYGVIFAVIIGYAFIGNSHLSVYTKKLLQLEKSRIQPSGTATAANTSTDEAVQQQIMDSIDKINDITHSFRLFIIIMFIVITFLLVTEFLFAGRGIHFMDVISDFANRITEGDLMTEDINIRGHKELQRVGSSLNKMKHKLANAVLNVSSTVRNLSELSEGLLASSNVITQDTQRQIDSTGQVAGAVEMMSVVVYDVTRNSVNAASSVKEAGDLATNGGAVVAQTIHGMTRISQSVSKSAEIISVLGERSEQIGEIVKVINDIANQTNLLALNAAIEAARAGEQGRGFAVVADEVRKLAERTTSATSEIGDMIQSIQTETRNAVDAMQSATREVDEGVELASQADESLRQIMNSVQQVKDMVQKIAESTKQQSSTGEEVSSNLQIIADENQRTARVAQEYDAATKEMHNLSRTLMSLISDFSVTAGDRTTVSSN